MLHYVQFYDCIDWLISYIIRAKDLYIYLPFIFRACCFRANMGLVGNYCLLNA